MVTKYRDGKDHVNWH